MRRGILGILFALALVLGLILGMAMPAGANVVPNPTFATVDRASGTTPSATINIAWEQGTINYAGTDAIHVTTSTATLDYASVTVPTNFTLESTTTISYWGYTVSGNVRAPDEIYLFLDIDGDGTFDITAGDVILTSHEPGPVASAWYGQWHDWTIEEPTNQWHVVPGYVPVSLGDYIDNGYSVLAVALTAGPSTTSGPVNVDVYFDQLTVNGNVVLDDDTGFIDVPPPLVGLPAPCIQDAVDAALPGDTINVAAGTYNESVTINKNNLTLNGEVGSMPAITGGLKLDNISGLTLQNFYVTGTVDPAKNSVVRMYGTITDLTVIDCVFDGENTADRDGFTGGQIEGDLTVTNSEFKDIMGWAVFETRSGSGGDGSAMGTITFAGNNVHHCDGTVVFRGLSTDWTDNVYIYENTFQDIGEAGVSDHWAAFEVNRASNVEIHDNEIRNVVECSWGEGQAMQLWQVGIVDIYNNTIEDNYMGIAFLNYPDAYNISNISIYHNNFSGNDQYALSVEDGLTGGPLDAENNWWDSSNGPQHAGNTFNVGSQGDVVSGNVLYVPWLHGPFNDVILPPSFTPVWNTDTGEEFSSIQAAIDDADTANGHTITCAAGTYTEAVTINKSLTLRGATYNVNKNGYAVPADYAWDNTVESIIVHPAPGSGYMAIVDIVDVDNVTFEGFIVQELNAVGNVDASLLRVYAHNQEVSNIVVRNNVIGPFTNTTAQDGAQGRMGLYIVNHPYSDQFGVVNSTFSGNKIFDCKGNGDNVFIWSSYYAYGAAGPASMNGTVIEDNEICGAHRCSIETAGGYSGLTIRNNKIYGNTGLPGDTPALKYGHGIMLIRGSGDKLGGATTAYGPENLTIMNNEIYDNEKNGIYMGPINKNYTITGNEIRDNGWDGIMLDLEGQYWNPTFEPAPDPYNQYACYDGSENLAAQFNNIYGNDSFGIRVIGAPTNGFVFKATNNWWGYDSGPEDLVGTIEVPPCEGVSVADMMNADGAGDGVSENVDYCPWLGASVENTTSGSLGDGDELDAMDEADTKAGVTGGSATVTVAEYSSNPGGGFSGGNIGKYVDIHITDISGNPRIRIELYYTQAELDASGVPEASLKLYWWNGSSWQECSPSGVEPDAINGYSGYIWAEIANTGTVPTLDKLTGTPFGGGTPPAAPGGGGGGLPTTISKVGSVSLLPYLDSQGRTRVKIILRSDDGVFTITIFSDTLVNNAEGNPLESMGIVTLSTPPPPPGYVLVGHAYDCLPDGANFAPNASMTFAYNEADIPDGVSERSLVLAYWDGEEWVNLPTTINAAANTATTESGHFTPFALVSAAPSAPPAPGATPAPPTPPAEAPAPSEAPAPIAWWIWVIAGAVVVGLITFFLVRRRAY